jgi:hypothetical protein
MPPLDALAQPRRRGRHNGLGIEGFDRRHPLAQARAARHEAWRGVFAAADASAAAAAAAAATRMRYHTLGERLVEQHAPDGALHAAAQRLVLARSPRARLHLRMRADPLVARSVRGEGRDALASAKIWPIVEAHHRVPLAFELRQPKRRPQPRVRQRWPSGGRA